MASHGRAMTRARFAVVSMAVAALGALTLVSAPMAAADTTQVPGMDVSGWQGNVDWQAAWAAGARFAYVKATEGTSYRNPYFAQQYNGSYQVGMIRGAYHFGRPDLTGGAAQADYFVVHGGGWSADGKTLPPMLDIEYNPNGSTCYGLSQSAMVDWIRSFSEEVHAKTTRWPMLYTTTDWWQTCTGNTSAFGNTHPLFIARYANTAGQLPSGWRYYTIWQYSDSGNKPGDQDTFAGSMQQLIKMADGDAAPSSSPSSSRPAPSTTSKPAPSTTAKPTTTAPTTKPAPSKPAPTTKSTPAKPTSSSARPSKSPSSKPAPSRSPSSTAKPTKTTPSTATTTTTAPTSAASAKPISGLIWAGPQQADPPQDLHGVANADNLVAADDTGTSAAPVTSNASTPTTTTAAPAAPAYQPPTTTPPAQASSAPLASTGTNAARMVVFGAALLIVGAILLLFVVRSRLRTRRRR